MDLNHHNYRSIIPQREHDLPLDQVLKPRHYGKKLPSRDSSDSKPLMNVPKLKPISKDKTEQSPKPTQVSSTDLVRELILDQSLKLGEMEQLMVRLKNIKSLKYEVFICDIGKKLTEKVREALVETVFSYNYQRFVSIMYAFSPTTLSSHLISAIFNGFVLAWKNQPLDSPTFYQNFFKLYCQQIPNCLNKPYIKWLCERAKQKEGIYLGLRGRVLEHVKEVIKRSNRQRLTENEKIIGLIVYFELMGEVGEKEVMRVVPLDKVKDYTDNDKLPTSNCLNPNNDISPVKVKQLQKLKQQQSKSSSHNPMDPNQPSTIITSNEPQIPVPPLLHTSIVQLLRQNNLKQTQKLIRSHKIPYTQYPEFVQKLELKYLEYIERSYPIYVVDELIENKMNLVENFVDMCLRRKKYQVVEHFVNKYRIRGVEEPVRERIMRSPLVDNDAFGPTQSHVLQQYAHNHFSQLSDFNITQKDVIWIDSKTIHYKLQANYLINLLYLKEVGIDSESTSGIHVFEKAKLEIIQLYDPDHNVVLLFDARDLKNDKKKRVRKGGEIGGGEEMWEEKREKVQEKKNINNQEQQNGNKVNGNKKEKGKSMNEPIDLEQGDKEQKLPIKSQSKSIEKSQKPQNSHQKAWFKFSKIFQHLLKTSTIFGHCLHTDIGDIIQELDLKIKPKQVKFTDSQLQFKKYFPQETKSRLGYLGEKCFGKELSKYEQCSAWDRRPLREAQRHYAALDAVLPYRLVKWMEGNKGKK